MFWCWGRQNKKIKYLRKEQGYTARELADKAKVDTIDIMKIDDIKLRDVHSPLKRRSSLM